ncbi:hypothetical protein G6F50_013843 [Rhizopus delemar]|uniref:histidine kinase n=1 Tax=Rhizopus delemar TaxID=936053 RepID=A0A9P6YC71_9FUNG|nr:hypothetical protein G6F50_013843 [Rhizopus delemar]
MAAAHKKIGDSIDYASLIQRAILPDRQLTQSLGAHHFVLWKPRDVVGGDFYVFRSDGVNCLLGIMDCAGHGVPGALMTMLALGTAALVWFGVTYGLRILTPLRTRLAQRRGELAPISDADVPEEIQPLISTIDDLFARQAEMITLQNRFIADAAHQLRSPLAGMALHVDQALAHGDPDTVREALQHIRRLNQRTARVSTQLLALSRAQTVPDTVEALDLCELVPQWVGMRVPEAIRDGIDLGYRGSSQPLRVHGNGAMLQEALDHLIDNALRYAGRDATGTGGTTAPACPRT